MPEKIINERDAKLVQWLNEAYAKEAELEVDLKAHIALTQKAAYKKRLQQHLKETREHKRTVARRIKALGGQATPVADVPGVPQIVGEAAGKAVSAVKGQVGTVRALITSQPETHLRNAQEELREEHVEIAIYTRIETFATEVGDSETAKLAKGIRVQEERMAKYLTTELGRLVKELVKVEIPKDQRTAPTRSRRRSTGSSAGSRSSATSSRARTSRTAGTRARGGASRTRSSASRARAASTS
jgi:ferritin-like metal-binding protein YciE